DEKLIYSKPISVTEGGILPFGNMYEHDTWFSRLVSQFAKENNIDIRKPLRKLTKTQMNLLSYGTSDKTYRVEGKNRFGKPTYIYEEFRGIVTELERRYKNTESSYVRGEIEKYMRETVCEECGGKRLKKESLGITVDQKSIADVVDYSITKAHEWISYLIQNNVLSDTETQIARLITREIQQRLQFLVSVGLDYLTLSRSAHTLSSGEAQRIRLASQIGTGLTGVLYVLDEPTIGLHMRDNQKLIDTLKNLRDIGNSVLVVEHDDQMMKQSDYIFDFGPGAGKLGGEVVAHSDPIKLAKNPKSITGKFINGTKRIRVNTSSQKSLESQKSIELIGCTKHNLKSIDVEFPLGNLIVMTGVSGSGKSSLLVETLYPALAQVANPMYRGNVPEVKDIKGVEEMDKVVLINQSPIGRTPRSNPATYTKVFDLIREVFANTKDAKIAGFTKSRFSFNVKSGRCENCQGQGQIKIEMQFMSDIWVRCEVCNGSRYSEPTLDIKYKGKTISDVLDMSVTEGKEFFHTHPQVVKKLDTIEQVGLGYIELGQSATTLSGGEAQRIKLSSELSKKSTGKTVYILDEPTTGLHFLDIERLLNVLHILVSRGNTVIIIEHNIDVIKNADHVIDIGPEGGEKGGEIVAAGTVNDIMGTRASYTGAYLKKYA
ncbi:excinuclease ABC subunit UvrA, partial [Patescibacteria group bacterium]